jgi:hypothetical protein
MKRPADRTAFLEAPAISTEIATDGAGEAPMQAGCLVTCGATIVAMRFLIRAVIWFLIRVATTVGMSDREPRRIVALRIPSKTFRALVMGKSAFSPCLGLT